MKALEWLNVAIFSKFGFRRAVISMTKHYASGKQQLGYYVITKQHPSQLCDES